jgi:imidazoleglycerol-phosphate dehydratase
MAKRTATIKRQTGETNVSLKLGLDGTGEYNIKTGVKMLDHLLSQTAKHGNFDLDVMASGDDEHHVSEDIAICLGKAFNEALGEKLGITRMGDAMVPMDDALALVAVDISGRGYCVLDLPFKKNDMRGFQTDLIRHFLEAFAAEARINLHCKILYGSNDHHKAEALFKALGRALKTAVHIDERSKDKLPSTKQRIEKP